MKRMLLLGLLSVVGSALPFLGGCESDHPHHHTAYGYGYYDDRPGHDERYREHYDHDWDRDRDYHRDWDHHHAGERW